jgi:hypothetical protein
VSPSGQTISVSVEGIPPSATANVVIIEETMHVVMTYTF